MIEITTGVVFLMASLYGSGHSDNHISNTSSLAAVAEASVPITDTRSFTDTKNVEAYLRKEYAETPILIEVARCESTFRQYNKDGEVLRGRVNSADIGVMQINEKYHGEDAEKLGHDIFTVEGNVAYAKYIYGKYGTKPWSASSKCWSKPSGDLAQK